MPEPVKITLPTWPDSPAATESVWAEPLGEGCYRIDNVTAFAPVGWGDTVRCDDGPDDRPRAVEVVARAEQVGVALIALTPAWSVAVAEVVRRLGETDLADRVRVETMQMSGPGAILAASVDQDAAEAFCDWVGQAGLDVLGLTEAQVRTHLQALFDEVPDGQDYHDQVRGPFLLDVHSAAWMDCPDELGWDADVLAGLEPPRPVALDDDVLAAEPMASWPEAVRELLVVTARSHPGVAELVNARLLRPAWHLVARLRWLADEVGTFPGPGWPLAVPATDAQADQWRAAWRDARDTDGTVRYAIDESAHAATVNMLLACGIDPDADPYTPVTHPEV